MATKISSRSFSIPCLIIFAILISTKATAQQSFVANYCQNERGNYTANSTYQANLDQVLSNILSLANHTAEEGRVFFNSSSGSAADRAYAVALCRGDATPDFCRACLFEARRRVANSCPNQKQAVVWYDHCMLRYSNVSMLRVMAYDTYMDPIIFINTQDVASSRSDDFFRGLWTLLNSLRSRASGGGALRKFATGNASVTNIDTVYALMQCSPDLSSRDCNSCLDRAVGDFRQCCGGKIGGQVITVSCNFRYETSPFYDMVSDQVPATSSPPPPRLVSPPPPPRRNNTNAANSQGKEKNRTRIVIVVVSSIGGFVGLILSVWACIIINRRAKRKTQTQHFRQPAEEMESMEFVQYSFETIKTATFDFCDENKLGQGGFGSVYRGKLPDGQDIAVKRLASGSGQGDVEFKNEVMLVAKLHHRNLVRLLGFCLEGTERILVYEFVPNASLDHFIFDPAKRANFNWDTRYRTVAGIARGLLYLHEDSRLRIIHRDLKASNILVDDEMNPKIADFGLARLFMVDQTQGNTNRVVGTYGYMAPEYAMRGHFSVKSDVFSFGVLLLEIVSGQKNNSFCNGDNVEDLLSYAWRNWCEGTVSDIVDPLLRHGLSSEITRCIHIALLCVQENVSQRPAMSTVVLMLNSNSLCLPVPSEPAFLLRSNFESDNSRSDQAQVFSENKASITELYPR